jgi:methyl-accepting chemotaxis protein
MNMNIGNRILSGYLAALVIFGVVASITYKATQDLVGANDWVTHTYQVKDGLSQILLSMVNAETGQRGFLLTGEDRFLDPWQAGQRDVDRYVQRVRTLVSDNPRQIARTSELQPMIARRLADMANVIDLRRTQGTKVIDPVTVERGKRDMDDLRRLVTEMDNEENALLEQRQSSARQSATFAVYAIVIGGIAAAVLIVILSIVIQRSITGPLKSFMQFAQKVGEGDLTQRAAISGNDELAALSGYLDRMALGLRDVAMQATAVSENLNAATSEILASAQQQAASTAEQAAAVQQANVTMTELSQSGAQISDRAKQVATAAEVVSSASTSGLQSVQSTNATMEGIQEQAEAVAENVIALSEKTQAVGDIITSVNEIAEQSHLLALNAAIQAAAAGDQGRTFSVVASEMKNLAVQSKQATVQVRAILGDIQKGINTSVMLTEEAVKRAEAGKQQAESADTTMRKLSENLDESIRAFQQIVAGSAQQQIGFEQVTQAFRNIGIASQETATSTRQSEKAAASLSALSQQLRDTVRRYRV